MNFFDDCDKILKIHYDFYFKGLFDENNEAIWKNLDKFFEISKQNLTIKDYGYIQAVHSQLTTDGYLAPIGRLHNLTKKHIV